MRRRIVVFVLSAAGAGVLACAGRLQSTAPTQSAPTGSPAASVSKPSSSPVASDTATLKDLRYTCDAFPFDPLVLEKAGNAELGDDALGVALRSLLASAELEPLPDSGWLLVGESDLSAEVVAHDASGRLWSISLKHGEGAWRFARGGDCRPSLVLPGGIGDADWVPDPGDPSPAASTQVFTALVTERSCASGRSSDGRIVGPALLMTPSQVLVGFGVRSLGGGYCIGNPSTPVVVDLGEPLGDRALIDAGHLPHVDVRTPQAN